VEPPLVDQQATRTGIKGAFEKLANLVKPEDVFILYLAGHGFTLEEGHYCRYYFAPWEVQYINQKTLRQGSIGQEQLRAWLENIKARKSLIILDTCNAGAFANLPPVRGLVEKTALDHFMQATGRAMLLATKNQQFAIEGYEGHGVFTHVLLEGLKGEADRKVSGNGDRKISISELADYATQEVPRITLKIWHREQTPMMELKGQNFPIAFTK
jgi:uncharacterized caspase-like protein